MELYVLLFDDIMQWNISKSEMLSFPLVTNILDCQGRYPRPLWLLLFDVGGDLTFNVKA